MPPSKRVITFDRRTLTAAERLGPGALTLAATAALVLAATGSPARPTVLAATVEAPGTVQAPRQLALGFGSQGRLVELDARPGEQVAAGQLLARLDPSAAEAELQTAEANLAAGRAQLAQLEQGPSPAQRHQLAATTLQAERAVAAASRTLTDARAAAAADATRLQRAVTQATMLLGADRRKLAAAEAAGVGDQRTLGADLAAAAAAGGEASADRSSLAASQARLLSDQETQATDQGSPPSNLAQLNQDAKAILEDQAAVNADEAKLAADQSSNAPANQLAADRAQVSADQAQLLTDQKQQADDQSTPPTNQAQLAADTRTVLADQAAVSTAQAKLADDTAAVDLARVRLTTDQARRGSDRQAVGLDRSAIASDRDAIVNARDAQHAGAVSERQTLDTAASALASARASLGATDAANAAQAQPPRIGALASDRAAVAVAGANLRTAQQALAETRLRAPFSGTVASVDAVIGQLLGAGQGAVGVLTLVDLGHLTVSAGFGGAEASLLAPGQPATITIPAIAEHSLAGRVLAVDPLPTTPAASPTASGAAPTNGASATSAIATSYQATIALSDPPATLRPGMTVLVSIEVGAVLTRHPRLARHSR